MDTFFDIMNVKNVNAHQFERKPNLVPFSSINDPRFSWLQNVESIRPFSFLNGVHGKWCKLDFELCAVHTEK